MRGWFWVGIGMMAYDRLGHAAACVARLTGNAGAWLWNTYAASIWPSISKSTAYDAFWTLWFATAIVVLIGGRREP